MSKFTRRPIATTFALITLVCIIYFISSSSLNLEGSLGKNLPINLSADSFKETINSLRLQQAVLPPPKKLLEETDLDEIVVDEKGVVTDDKQPETGSIKQESQLSQDESNELSSLNEQDVTTTPFMPKMANETLKQELGRSSWRLFHTILARYPDKPSLQEQTTLSTYIQLFAQVYPCGDCARHFQRLLAKYPPQTKSRKTAALWGCHIHNKVNERLGKNEYDCTTILEDYDCGCGSDELEKDDTLGKGNTISDARENTNQINGNAKKAENEALDEKSQNAKGLDQATTLETLKKGKNSAENGKGIGAGSSSSTEKSKEPAHPLKEIDVSLEREGRQRGG